MLPAHVWGQEADGPRDPGGGPSAAQGRRQPRAQGGQPQAHTAVLLLWPRPQSRQKQGLVSVFWLFCELANPPLHSHQDPVFAWVPRLPQVQPQQEFTPSYHIHPCPCLDSVCLWNLTCLGSHQFWRILGSNGPTPASPSFLLWYSFQGRRHKLFQASPAGVSLSMM